MAINLEELRARPLDPEVADEIDKFETAIEEYFAGEITEDVFRVMRLNQGIYGQRQGGTNQMVRVKIPHGRVTPEQLEILGHDRHRLLARLGSPHHPPERAVPLRPAARRPRGAPRSSGRSASPAARRAATPCATSPAATSPAPARSRCSTSPRGPRPSPTCSSATRSRSASRASSRSTSPAARRTAARRCSTTSASSPSPDPARTVARARLQGVPRRRPRHDAAPGAGARGLHRPARTCSRPSRPACARSTTTATATTSCGPA